MPPLLAWQVRRGLRAVGDARRMSPPCHTTDGFQLLIERRCSDVGLLFAAVVDRSKKPPLSSDSVLVYRYA